jgi:hypothetical protein
MLRSALRKYCGKPEGKWEIYMVAYHTSEDNPIYMYMYVCMYVYIYIYIYIYMKGPGIYIFLCTDDPDGGVIYHTSRNIGPWVGKRVVIIKRANCYRGRGHGNGGRVGVGFQDLFFRACRVVVLSLPSATTF